MQLSPQTCIANHFKPQIKRRKKKTTTSSPFAFASFPTYFGDQPRYKLAKLQYNEVQDVTIAESGLAVVKFRANSLYDPTYAVGGHQPYGFDQLMALYDHFTVLYSKCEVTRLNSTSTSCVVGIVLSDVTGRVDEAYAANGYDGIMELNRKSPTILASSNLPSEKVRSVSLSFNASNYFGRPVTSIVGASDFIGTSSADPAEEAVYEIFFVVPIPTALAAAPWNVKLTYYAVFTEPTWYATS